MNERIKELFTEAGLHTLAGYAPGHEWKMEKFAELIVKEALKKIDEVGYKTSNNISSEDTELFKIVLKQHFGVE